MIKNWNRWVNLTSLNKSPNLTTNVDSTIFLNFKPTPIPTTSGSLSSAKSTTSPGSYSKIDINNKYNQLSKLLVPISPTGLMKKPKILENVLTKMEYKNFTLPWGYSCILIFKKISWWFPGGKTKTTSSENSPKSCNKSVS